ncbi:MAG: hypothetical protein HRT57_14495, partial [Crocinitomicaceae bacterium]|nr:hypothetical protein [Crocinitomicaceae bacterium]
LKSVRTKDQESDITTHNLIYDGATGQPIYTSVENEFEDELYSFSVPGHRIYEGLEAAYQHQNLKLRDVFPGTNPGELLLPNLVASAYFLNFSAGDELWVWPETGDKYTDGEMVTVLERNTQTLLCIKQDGNLFSPAAVDHILQVVKPGHRNIQSAIVGNMTSRDDWRTGECNFGFPYEQMTRNVLSASAVTMNDSWHTDASSAIEATIAAGSPLNPYKLGMKGIWRPDASYVYVKERNNTGDIRVDGDFEMTKSFPWTEMYTDPSTALMDNWELANTITRYSTKGFEIENQDAIGVYSAAQYGYGDALVTAVAGNAKYNEIIFDGFEDYNYYLSNTSNHWNLGLTGAQIVTTEAHSGDYSFQLNGLDSKTFNADVAPDCSNISNYDIGINQVTVNDCGCNGKFAPETGETYYVSLWVKETAPLGQYLLNYTAPQLVVDNGVQTVTLAPSGNIIEGWQQIRGEFTVDNSSTSMSFTLNNLGTANIYMDDIRIHPVNAGLVSYVYDVGNLKPVAVLDNNNYATFYAYDEEGRLVKTSRETIKGIKTISEGRTGNAKNL